jgi:hypothetical protein
MSPAPTRTLAPALLSAWQEERTATPAHLSGASLESRSGGYLMYAVIRRYPFAPSARAAVDGNVREILVPRFQAVPEFVTYY